MPNLDRRTMLTTGASALAAASLAAPAAFSAAKSAKPLAGKSMLITGTSSGFGRLGAEIYARQGAKVFATMRNLPRPEAGELRELARKDNLDITVLELDVLSDELVAAAVSEAERLTGGPLDVLVNNAGIVIGGPVEVHDMEATQLGFDTNVIGMQRLHRAVLPGMRKRKSGLIVNISSQVGRIVMPGMGLYAATKHAVEAMSEQLAYEMVPFGIEVVIIEPGGYPTEVGQNRAKYTNALAARAEAVHTTGYPEMVERMKIVPDGRTWPNAPDPADIPNAIAEIVAMAPGTRPLRRAVHPGKKWQLEINEVARKVQMEMLGQRPATAEIAKAVYD